MPLLAGNAASDTAVRSQGFSVSLVTLAASVSLAAHQSVQRSCQITIFGTGTDGICHFLEVGRPETIDSSLLVNMALQVQ